jgi:hypothetical protein
MLMLEPPIAVRRMVSVRPDRGAQRCDFGGKSGTVSGR